MEKDTRLGMHQDKTRLQDRTKLKSEKLEHKKERTSKISRWEMSRCPDVPMHELCIGMIWM